jgi:hypothetical protein
MKYKQLLIFFLVFLFASTVYSAEITNFNITIDIKSPDKAIIKEVWDVSYNPYIYNDKVNFKNQIIAANIDLDKFEEIDPRLKPNIYLNNFSNVSIIFDETKDQININYEISDLVLENFYETEDDILWKFNENLFRSLIVNNLYVIPSNSKLSIKVYDPLVFRDTNPKAEIVDNTLYWNSFSTNQIKVLIYEKKPPKPSFVIIGSSDSNIFYYLIIVFIILLSIILIFRDSLEKSIKNFVIKNSVIKPKKQKKEYLIDSELFED